MQVSSTTVRVQYTGRDANSGTKYCVHIGEVIGSVLQYISFHQDFVYITIWLTKHPSSSSSPLLSSPHHEIANALFLLLFPTITTCQTCTLPGRQAFPKHSGLFSLWSLSATLPEQSNMPPTSSWNPSASPQLLRNNAAYVHVSVRAHTLRV